MAEVRMFLDHLEKYSPSLTDKARQTPQASQALAKIAADRKARERYLEFARDADEPATRARMIELAYTLGWLTADEKRAELMRMIGDRLAGTSVTASDVDLVCSLNGDHALDRELERLRLVDEQPDRVPHAAVLACLGSAQARARTLRALTSARDDDVEIAQVYLRHRPIDDSGELRMLTSQVADMKGSVAQVRALDTLARYRLSDRESLARVAQMFPLARTIDLQRAIAGILIRADYEMIARPELIETLTRHRLKSPDGEDLIDALIRRLKAKP
jgi:hypothetical protein